MVHQCCSWHVPRAIAVSMLLMVSSSLIAQETRPTDTAARVDEPINHESPEIAAIRATAKAFTTAFNDADAQTLAELWTENGEYIDPDGNLLIGPARIEAAYAEFFKLHPGATLEVTIDSIRLLGPRIAVEEGTSRLRFPDEKSKPALGGYRALHVRGDDGWRMASVREWTIDSATAISLEDIAWIAGEWDATNGEIATRVVYKWDGEKAFITGNYSLSRGEDVISQGTEVIARDPAGGLRSWRFDESGGFSEGFWTWDGRAWIINSSGVHSDGTDVSARALLTPLDENAFTWQTVSRSIDGEEAVGTRPIKVTRASSSSKK